MTRWQSAITCPAFRRLRGVGYSDPGFECRVFGEVTPGWESLGDRALVALMATDTSHLDCLDARNSDYGGHEALFTSDQVKRLSRLAIRPQGFGDMLNLIKALEGSRICSLTLAGFYLDVPTPAVLPTLTELRIESDDLDLPFRTGKLERFAYAWDAIKNEPVDRLLAAVRGVRELILDGDTVPGFRRLAKADLLYLRELRVHGRDIGYAEAEEILRMPCAARRRCPRCEPIVRLLALRCRPSLQIPLATAQRRRLAMRGRLSVSERVRTVVRTGRSNAGSYATRRRRHHLRSAEFAVDHVSETFDVTLTETVDQPGHYRGSRSIRRAMTTSPIRSAPTHEDVGWYHQMCKIEWAQLVTTGGAAAILINTGPFGPENLIAAREAFVASATWSQQDSLMRWLRLSMVTSFVAALMLLVYAWVQPIESSTQPTAVVLAASLTAGAVLAIRGKLAGALLLVLSGLGLIAQTLATALIEGQGQPYAPYYTVFWCPAAIVAIVCGMLMARPLLRLLRS